MDNNPGETPNPLSAAKVPSPEPAPTQPTQPVQPVQTTDVVAETVEVESLDPNGRSMEKAAPVAAPAKKKTGLIVGIIICAVALIGGIVAAVLIMMNMNKGDAVAQAMQKIMSGSAPTNVTIDGDINILVNAEGSPIKRINVDLDSDIITGSMINTSSAVLTFTTYNDKDYSVEFDEVYAANGDLYFKIDGATAVLEDSEFLGLISDGEMADAYSSNIIDVFEVVDGVWLRISTDEMKAIGGSFVPSESPISCVTDLVTNVNKNSNATTELYNKYPFVTSTTENVIIPSKQGPVYQINLDSKNFVNFANSSINSDVMNNLYSCLGYENNVGISEEEVENLVTKLPKIYVEVNGNNDFTRLYLESDVNDGVATATIDLGFNYPANVNVSEPVEYTDFSKVISQILSGFYNLEDVEAEVVEVENE